MADWSVRIVVDSTGATVFQTQLQPGNTSTTYMAPGDTVSWNNTTKESIQPALPGLQSTPGSQFYLSDPIPPDQPSKPAWVAPGNPVPATYAYSATAGGKTIKGSIVVAAAPK